MKKVLVASLFLALFASIDAQRATLNPIPSFGEPGISPDGVDHRIRQRRRHLGSAEPRRRRAAARLASRDREPADVLARRHAPRVHLDAHRQRRRLRARAHDRQSHASDLRRCERADERVVARQPVRVLLDGEPRPLEHERRLPRRRRRRHADAGRGRPLRDRVLRVAVARRPAPSRSRRARFAGLQWWRKGHSHLDESEIWIVHGPVARGTTPVTSGGAKDAWPMWGRRPRSTSCRIAAARRTSGRADAAGTAPPRQADAASPTAACCGRRSTTDGRTIAFERDLGDLDGRHRVGQAREVPIALRGAPAGGGGRAPVR